MNYTHKYFLYAHLNQKGEIFYIGRGTFKKGSTLKVMYKRAYETTGRPEKWKKAAEQGYTVEIFYSSDDPEDIKIKEMYYIGETPSCVNQVVGYHTQSIFIKFFDIASNVKLIKLMSSETHRSWIITDEGELFNSEGNKLKPTDNGNGYMYIILSNKKVRVAKSIHSLMAEAFLEKPSGNEHYVVNHKDSNKANNKLSNLEWVTQKENINHGINQRKLKINKNE